MLEVLLAHIVLDMQLLDKVLQLPDLLLRILVPADQAPALRPVRLISLQKQNSLMQEGLPASWATTALALKAT